MNCPKCGQKMPIELELTGGCTGGHGPDSYCYCDSPDVHAVYRCHTRDAKGWWCPQIQKDIKIKELSDEGSIARWLTEHYEEKS